MNNPPPLDLTTADDEDGKPKQRKGERPSANAGKKAGLSSKSVDHKASLVDPSENDNEDEDGKHKRPT